MIRSFLCVFPACNFHLLLISLVALGSVCHYRIFRFQECPEVMAYSELSSVRSAGSDAGDMRFAPPLENVHNIC
jgi:hypothetical protein